MASSNKDYRFGGKQKVGNSRKAWFAKNAGPVYAVTAKNARIRQVRHQRFLDACKSKVLHVLHGTARRIRRAPLAAQYANTPKVVTG